MSTIPGDGALAERPLATPAAAAAPATTAAPALPLLGAGGDDD